MPKSDHPSIDFMILALLAAIVGLCVLACFYKPASESGFNAVLDSLITVFGTAFGAKAVLTQIGPAPVQAIEDKVIPVAVVAPTLNGAPLPADPK